MNIIPFPTTPRASAPAPAPAPAPAAPASPAPIPTDLGPGNCDRNSVIAFIRAALRARSGRAWSVTGGTGTAWGWIRIDAPPARRTWARREIPSGLPSPQQYAYEWHDTGEPGQHMSPEDRATLAALLDISEGATWGGVSVPACSSYYLEYVDRARGAPPRVIGRPYWD